MIAHDLWVEIIRHIAERYCIMHGCARRPDDEFDKEVSEKIEMWLEKAMPTSVKLAWVCDTTANNYFSNIDLTWEEKINYSGDACGDPSHHADQLRMEMSGYVDAQEAITEDSVEEYYNAWRWNFFQKIIKIAKLVSRE